MISLAEKLCKNFEHVRVDFYVLNDDSIRFGEMTFTSSSGDCKWIPETTDVTLGELINLDRVDPYKYKNESEGINFIDCPDVSIIIPTFNNRKYIDEAFNSVSRQMHTNLEIIFVDDGSTDGTLERLKEFSLIDPRVVVRQQGHKGAGAARNVGLSVARGKYLLFLDADDVFELNLVNTVLEKLIKTDSDVCVYKADQFFEGTGRIESLDFAFNKKYIPNKEVFNADDFKKYVFNTFQNWAWNKMFKREFIISNNIKFQEIMKTNDFSFVARAIILAKKITTVDSVFVHYRKNTGVSTQDTNYMYPLEFLKAFDDVEHFMREHNKFQEFKNSFINHEIGGCMYNLFSIKTKESFNELYNELKKRGSGLVNSLKREDCIVINRYNQLNDLLIMNFDDFTRKYNIKFR